MIRTPMAVNSASNAAVNLASRPRIKELEVVRVTLKGHHQVAGLLVNPLPPSGER